MYAQLLTTSAAAGAGELVRHELVTLLRCQDGFCGALCLTDDTTLLVLVLWETEEQARTRPLIPRLATAETRDVWEVCGRS